MIADMKCLPLSRLTSGCEYIICENYNYYSTMTKLVLRWAGVHCPAEIKYANNVSNTLQATANISTAKISSPMVLMRTHTYNNENHSRVIFTDSAGGSTGI